MIESPKGMTLTVGWRFARLTGLAVTEGASANKATAAKLDVKCIIDKF